ncbi:hypothetical protein D1631_13425 [Chryseobacterium nematophagum]|uniref:Fibrobacter succinogenes major paralogous domain-containing protein n=1 Tax=Chryseobacterium nematophagum TaxID=2305228 RepID=A0A3M7TH53_9FLAO|nr:hypothetical protein [Chryseobacterium nematophagum]RNA62861.1 hypothetical protein D1631_13425 [Chryseobacterium nematophagum]
MKNKFINLEKVLSMAFFLMIGYFYGQVRIANSANNQAAANSSAFIDASSNPAYNLSPNVGKGLLYPRTDLTTFAAFSQAAFGLANNYPYYYDGFMVFNTAVTGVAGVGSTEGTLCRGFWYYDNPTTNITGGTWKPFRPDLCSSIINPTVTTLNCAGATTTGTLTEGAAASGVSVQVPYTGGNGATYPAGGVISSTGVTGLTATLQAGTLASGNGTLTYAISGTPSGTGTASFAITFGGQNCTFTVNVGNSGPTPTVTTLNCAGVTTTGTLTEGAAASGVSVQVPYTGGNGATYPAGGVISSTGVTGLTATLQAGTLASGNGTLTYAISGTPSGTGTASFAISFGGQSCTFTLTVGSSNPTILVLDCSGSVDTGNLTQGIAASGVATLIPYLGGNGVSYSAGSLVPSTGVLGLFAQVQGGTLLNGSGYLNIYITGTPISSGIASFAISFGGQTCTLTRMVAAGDSVVMCGSSKSWSRYNLGADTNQNPDNPTLNSIGNYYQWGRSAVRGNATDLGPVSGWNDSNAIPDNSWNLGTEASPIKNVGNDPCPSGYRVPSATEWVTLYNNNTATVIGTFASDPNSFDYLGAALVLTCSSNNAKLTFPAGGLRRTNTTSSGVLIGQIYSFNESGNYFASSPGSNSTFGYTFSFTSSAANLYAGGYQRSNATTIRCISE